MSTKVLVAPVGSLEAHCAGLALEAEGIEVTRIPTDDVQVVVLFAGDDAAMSAVELFEDDGARPLLMVSPSVDSAALQRARRVGAVGLLAWDCSTERLAGEIDDLASGAPRSSTAGDPLDNLTARERDIVMLLREGASNEAIASSLGISYHTVRTHVANVLAKLGVGHRHAVATMARGSERLPASTGRSMARGTAC